MQMREVIELDLGEVEVSDFTDGGSTDGTYDFTTKKPQGFLPIAGKVETLEAIVNASAATATTQVGISSDADAFVDGKDSNEEGTINATPGAAPAAGIDAETTVRLTLSHSTDFGLFTAGKMSVKLYGIDMIDQENIVAS